jgi:hypothetical protein
VCFTNLSRGEVESLSRGEVERKCRCFYSHGAPEISEIVAADWPCGHTEFSSREFRTELRFYAMENVSMWHVLRSAPPHQSIGLSFKNVLHFRWFSGGVMSHALSEGVLAK